MHILTYLDAMKKLGYEPSPHLSELDGVGRLRLKVNQFSTSPTAGYIDFNSAICRPEDVYAILSDIKSNHKKYPCVERFDIDFSDQPQSMGGRRFTVWIRTKDDEYGQDVQKNNTDRLYAKLFEMAKNVK